MKDGASDQELTDFGAFIQEQWKFIQGCGAEE